MDENKCLTRQTTSEKEDNLNLASLDALLSRLDRLIIALSPPQTHPDNQLWGIEQIAAWMKLSIDTITRFVITRSDFPIPVQPVGTQSARKRWFAGEVLRWAKQHRTTIAKPRAGRRRILSS
jgi:hypothetical protein